jgi:hypothetical protein
VEEGCAVRLVWEIVESMQIKEEYMQFLRPARAWYVCAVLTALLSVTVAASSINSRAFSGYFDVSGVQEQGDLVQVTLHLRLFNTGDSDAKSVIITLVEPTPPMTLHGNFPPVKVWKSKQTIEMSQTFTVTKAEFREWMQPPAQPNLVILFQDGNGKTWQRGAQISRRPMLPQPE